MIIISILCSIITGRIPLLSNSIILGANDSISVIISFLGITSVWMGLMKIAEKSGLTNLISKLFSPIINILFKGCGYEASKAISLNITANFLGLGNAATPFGIKAVSELQKTHHDTAKFNNSLAMITIINIVPLQLIPTMLCSIRQKYNSVNPMGIIPYAWVTTIVSLIFGIIMTIFLKKAKGG